MQLIDIVPSVFVMRLNSLHLMIGVNVEWIELTLGYPSHKRNLQHFDLPIQTGQYPKQHCYWKMFCILNRALCL